MKILNSIICIFTLILMSQNVLAALPESATESFEAQFKLANNTALPMTARWKALMQASEVADSIQIQKIMNFSKDKDWFMRNASIVALEKMGTDLVYDQAKSLITDKALVVRSAAVEQLSKLTSSEVRKIFSEELSKKYNFNGTSSLWIRPQIMKYLVQRPTAEEKSFFVKYLYEKDEQMAVLSTEALQKLTNIRFSGATQTEVVAQWKKYSKEQKW